jgi:hypothetical protein
MIVSDIESKLRGREGVLMSWEVKGKIKRYILISLNRLNKGYE